MLITKMLSTSILHYFPQTQYSEQFALFHNHSEIIKAAITEQFVPGNTYDRTCACPHTCKIPSTSENSPVPTSLSIVQLHMPNRYLDVATATQVTVTFYFKNSALSCFILNETFDKLQQQKLCISDAKIMDRRCHSK